MTEKRIAVFAVAVLLLANLAGTAVVSAARRPFGPKLAADQLAHADTLFRIATDFHRELENVTGQAPYNSDDEKRSAKDFLSRHTLAFGLFRLEYDHLKRTGRADDVLALLRAALLPMHGGDGPGLMDPPAFTRFVPGQYESTFRQIDAAQTDSYATRSKLEALQKEFKVLAKSLLDDLK
jgi:hypothetical protein